MPCQYPRDKGDGPELCGAKAEFMRQLHGTWWEPACADCVKGREARECEAATVDKSTAHVRSIRQ